ncbi:unnamed protein product, partial [Meganyctiphanes norvegica]
MASKFRSLIANKVIQALDRFPIGGKGIKSSRVIPSVKVVQKKGINVEFSLSLKSLEKDGLLDNNSLNFRSSLSHFGSNLLEKLDTDSSIPGVYLVEEKSDVKIHFKVDQVKLISEVLDLINNLPDSFWRRSAIINKLQSQNVVVEYSSPNLAKPFHVGHLRSTIIGNFIANMHASFGHQVTRINFLGDWGTQFGFLKYGYDAKKLNESDLNEDPIKKLYEVYVWANKEAEKDPSIAEEAKHIFSQMEQGDTEHLKAWNLFRNISIKEFEQTYRRLNVFFDEYHGESMYSAKKCDEITHMLEDKGLLEHLEDGRKVYEVENGRKVTVVKSDGSTIYLSRDIAAAIDRERRYKFDRHYYVVDNAQTDHFVALFSILKRLGFEWSSGMQHVKFGRIQGMSSRKGTAVFLHHLLDEARELMAVKQQETLTTRTNKLKSCVDTADHLAVTAVLVADMKQRRQRDYVFSWDKALQNTGDTGVKLQYVHCRLLSLEESCPDHLIDNVTPSIEKLNEPEAIALIMEISRFDEVLFECYESLEPCVLVNYLFKLSNTINAAFKKLPVKTAPEEIAAARLSLLLAARHTLAAGMKILGLQPLSQM